MRSILLYLIIIFQAGFNLAYGYDFKHSTDSLLNKMKQRPDTALFADFIDQVSTHIFTDPILVYSQLQKALILAEDYRLHQQMARFYLLSGISFDLRGMYDSAFVMYDKGLEIAEKHNLQNLMGELYNNYGISLVVPGRLDESIGYTLKARDIFEKTGDSSQLARVYNNLGSRYSEIRFSDLALEYYLKAAEINEKSADTRRLAYNYGNIGLLYHNLHRHDKALGFFKKSINLLDTVLNRWHYSIAVHNLALAYMGLQDYTTALKYEKQALELSHELNDELGIATALIGMANLHNIMGKTHEALDFYDQSEIIAKRLGAPTNLMKIYEGKALIYAEMNNFQKAFHYNQQFLTIKDSLLTYEQDKAVQRLKEFEDTRKQQEIQILTKDAEIQGLSLRRQKVIRNSVAVVGFLILLLAIGLYNRFRFIRRTRNELATKNKIINIEKTRSDNLLLNILPAETAEELKNKGSSEARHFEMVTVMFTDFKGFTKMAEVLSAQELVSEIDHCFKAFDQIITNYGIEKIKTIGDSYMCAGGLPVPNTTNPVDVVMAALEIQEFMSELKNHRKNEDRPYFELRVGIHTGPVIAGIVGFKKFQYDIWGDTVNIASRMESGGEVGKVNISQMTREKVKDHFDCLHRGKIEAKNKGAIDMYFVEGLKTAAQAQTNPPDAVISG